LQKNNNKELLGVATYWFIYHLFVFVCMIVSTGNHLTCR